MSFVFSKPHCSTKTGGSEADEVRQGSLRLPKAEILALRSESERGGNQKSEIPRSCLSSKLTFKNKLNLSLGSLGEEESLTLTLSISA
jgi:hypothetical protein